MKRKIVIITLSCILLGSTSNVNAQGFLKAVGRMLGSAAEAVGGAVLYSGCISAGMTEEEAREGVSTLYDALEINTHNAEMGISYMNTENKYERQDIVKDFAFDAVAQNSKNPELVEYFRGEMHDQLTYLNAVSHATTDKEKREALTDRVLSSHDRMYDVIQNANSRRAAYLENKLKIRDQLLAKGYTDPNFALDVAGTILAIQNSEDMTEEEKEHDLRALGFITDVETIQQVTEEVTSMSSDKNDPIYIIDTPSKDIPSCEPNLDSIRQVEEAMKQERDNAIQCLASTVIAGFAFDKTDVTDSQKEELDSVFTIMNKYPDINVTIVGHTCKVGYENINMRKGLKRAESAKMYLIEKGISEDRIAIDSKGESQPIDTDLKRNRRISFIVQ